MDRDVLKKAVELGIIDMSHVQAQMDMYKREQILAGHPYEIWQGTDGFWRTYVRDGLNKRKMVKKKAYQAVEDTIVAHYKALEEKSSSKSFDEVYHLWRNVQDTLVCENTTVKYDSDYKRYFKDTKFSNMSIDKITPSDIKVFICKLVKDKHLCKKACKTLFGYIRNTVEYAIEQHFISENPMVLLRAKEFFKYCTESDKPLEKKVVSNEQMRQLYEQFRKDHEKDPSYMPTYAVELATLTGMRVAELSALKWDCIKEDYILIDKSEKQNRRTKQFFIDKTKNSKIRKFPITPEIQKLLDTIKRIEIEYGFICEWVFADADGRVHAPVISSCSKNKCKQIGIDEKGIHAYRKTLNSKLRCNGVSATVASSLLGHSEEVNEEYYTFDVVSMKDKAAMVSIVNQKVG